jgi:hypothetical protein
VLDFISRRSIKYDFEHSIAIDCAAQSWHQDGRSKLLSAVRTIAPQAGARNFGEILSDGQRLDRH